MTVEEEAYKRTKNTFMKYLKSHEWFKSVTLQNKYDKTEQKFKVELTIQNRNTQGTPKSKVLQAMEEFGYDGVLYNGREWVVRYDTISKTDSETVIATFAVIEDFK